MNVEINTEITVTVRWNNLERLIIKSIYDVESYPLETDYTRQDLITLNSDIATAMNPNDNSIVIPERFPVKELFNKTENIISNIESAESVLKQVEYDHSTEL